MGDGLRADPDDADRGDDGDRQRAIWTDQPAKPLQTPYRDREKATREHASGAAWIR